jgi:hypothetical protein
MLYVVAEIGDGSGPVKIGTTDGPMLSRLRGINNGNWRTLEVIAATYGSSVFEWEVHHRFRDDRVRGEWFRRSDAVSEFIRRNACSCADADAFHRTVHISIDTTSGIGMVLARKRAVDRVPVCLFRACTDDVLESEEFARHPARCPRCSHLSSKWRGR